MSTIRSLFRQSTRPVRCALLLAGVAACAPAMGTPRPEMRAGHEITSEDIARLGSSTAWHVLEQSGVALSGAAGAGSSTRLSRRGMGSLHLDESPLLILDGVRTHGLELLHQIPGREIEHILVLSGIDASTLYGVNAGGGAIVLRTKRGGGSGTA